MSRLTKNLNIFRLGITEFWNDSGLIIALKKSDFLSVQYFLRNFIFGICKRWFLNLVFFDLRFVENKVIIDLVVLNNKNFYTRKKKKKRSRFRLKRVMSKKREQVLKLCRKCYKFTRLYNRLFCNFYLIYTQLFKQYRFYFLFLRFFNYFLSYYNVKVSKDHYKYSVKLIKYSVIYWKKLNYLKFQINKYYFLKKRVYSLFMKKIFSFNKQIAFMTFRRFIKRLEKKSRKKSKVFRNKNKKYLSRNVNKNKRLNKFSSKKKIVKFNRIKKKKFNKLSLRAVKNRRRLLLRKKRKIFRLRNNFIRIYKHSIHHFKKYSRINKRSTSDKVCIKNLYFYNKYRSLLFIKRKRIKLSKFNLKKIKLKLFSNKELFSKKYFLKKYYRFFQKILSEYSLNKENKISFYNYNLNGLYEFKNIIKKSFKNKKISKNRNVKLKVHKKSKNDLTKDQNRKFLVHQKIYLKVLKLYLERMLLCYLKDTNIKVNIQNFSYTKVYAEVQKQVKLILIANKFSKYKVIRRKNFRHILFIICLAFHLQKPYLITNYIALLLQRIRRHKMVCFMIFDIIEYLKLYYTGYNAIRLEVCGRFGGQNKRKRLILQTKESNLNSHTFSVPLYYSFAESYTFCGVFGIKLWMSHKVIDRKQKQEANQLILNTIIRES